LLQGLIVSIWIVLVTLGAVYMGATMHAGKTAHEGGGEHAPKVVAAIKLKAMTVPVIAGGSIQGFVLMQISINANQELVKTLPQPPDLLLNDEVFKTIYAEEQIDFKRMTKQDLPKLSKRICENINKRAGAPVAEDAFIQELHYMNKKDASAEAQAPR
jgi:hypothetical protein